MIIQLVIDVVKKLNFFPVKGGVSKYHSPCAMLQQSQIDYKKHCMIGFGSYVQAVHHPDPTNNETACTIDGIYLGFVDSLQGGHMILDLKSKMPITRSRVIKIPSRTQLRKQLKLWLQLKELKD